VELLKLRLYLGNEITEQILLEYDHNIYRHTQEINKNRDKEIKWKYFQYLSLLFTEIYLDKYFTNKEKLLEDIHNYHTFVFNNDPLTNHEIPEFTEDDLNKLAFWSATGSGKTLLMHVNILQFQHYSSRASKKLNRTILITPNEGLTNQHIEEFQLSNIDAHQFNKSQASGLFGNMGIDIIEITKLADTDGDKTVAVESFEGNNLVLVDEGHRGSSGDKWKNYRDQLSTDGFAFEYSATFGQAINSVNSQSKRKEMLEEYAKATLFDYSYSYFYNDGYGKDYQILNMANMWDDNQLHTYLTACLLNYYEQLRLYIDTGAELHKFNIERPLAIFVGSSVTATDASNNRENSDVITILKFFQKFIKESSESIRNVKNLLSGTDGLVNKNNNPIFTRSFKYLRSYKFKDISLEQIYDDLLNTVFHCSISGAILHLDNLRGLDGEIGMRIGNGEYFGVINVGDSAKLTSMCAAEGISAMSKDYTDKSLFESINRQDSNINILIGSKKFTEGWSSWRVSTMGLMNVGRSEGSQIIQLFGRGVRLKGYKMSLKRSSALDTSLQPTSKPKYLQTLETLNIFGVRANYMDEFKSILEDMGLPSNDNDYEEIILPILPVVDLGKTKLKCLKVKDGLDFKKEVTVDIKEDMLNRTQPVSLDVYAKIQAMGSLKGLDDAGATVNTAKFTEKHLSFINWNKVYFDLIDFKNDRAWFNMNISAKELKKIICNSCSWYELAIPAHAMEFTNYKKCVDLWQSIVTILLKAYTEKVYNNRRSKWMCEHVEIDYIDYSNPNFEEEYQILIHKNLSAFRDNLLRLKDELNDKKFRESMQIGSGHNFDALYILGHLYQPLMYINRRDTTFIENNESLVKICPVPLNEGEMEFLRDIDNFIRSDKGKEFMKCKELYLLRNKSKQGIGFFDASGFYPDFILWFIAYKQQYVAFVDPKGITHLKQFSDSKIELYKNIKDIEKSLDDEDIFLNSYIISNTPLRDVRHWTEFKNNPLTDNEILDIFSEHHVYFQRERKDVYIPTMLHSMLEN
ncbi:MAG: DEAD/DEAH box helicase family protein, partial [Prevotella sp.]|nr:DEAD/DEAH box helicase family protein [Prevotella sp.]